MPPRSVPVNNSRAVVAEPLSNDDFMALLSQSGMIQQSTSDFHRMTLRSGMLVTDAGTPKELLWPPTKQGKGPAFLARVVTPPKYMNVFFLAEDERDGAFDARKVGLGELNGRFVKKYDDPNDQAEDTFANLEAYEAVARETGTRGKFRADIELQIVPEDGNMTGEEPIYTLSLNTTSALDWRGTKANPRGGIVQDTNFIVQLGELAMRQAAEAGGDSTAQKKAVLDAMTALRLGNVVAAVYIRQASNAQNGNTWSVVSFEPVHIALDEEVTALPDPAAAGPEQNSDDIPI